MNEYLDFAIKIAQAAGKKLMKNYARAESGERDSSVTTKFDLLIDKDIRAMITGRFPDHSFLSEESGWTNNHSPYVWIVDSIDGTGNYLNHNPFFSVSVALWKNGRPVLGVIEAPALMERYVAVKGQGAWLIDIKTGKKRILKVSAITDLKNAAMLICGGHSSKRKRLLQVIDQFYARVTSLRKLGSAAIELAWVASGRADAFILPQGRLWDIAAGLLLVREAGGRILDFSGRPYDLRLMPGRKTIDFVAANRKLKLPRKMNY